MIITFSKVFATIFALMVLPKLIVEYRAKKESFQMTVFWAVIWVGVLILAYFPGLVEWVIKKMGSVSGVETIYGIAFIFIMYINYRIYAKSHRIEQNLRKIATQVGLKEFE